MRPLVHAGLDCNAHPTFLGQMCSHDSAESVCFRDDSCDFVGREQRPWRWGACRAHAPRCAWLAARIEADLDHGGATGDERPDGPPCLPSPTTGIAPSGPNTGMG